MLERVNAALFKAPRGARIQIVADAQDNNGVNDANFEYATQPLDPESILELPGCSFTVADDRERLQAQVTFHPAAPASARYDLFEIENGVKSPLQKSVRKSDSVPLIAFTIEPVAFELEVGERAAPRAGVRKRARKRARKRTAARGARKTSARKTTRARTSARKTTGRRAARKRSTSRKRR